MDKGPLAHKALFFLLSLTALTLPFDGYNYGGIGSVFRILGSFTLYVFLTLLLLSPRIRIDLLTSVRSPIAGVLIAFVVWSIVTSVWAPNPNWALSRAITYVGLLGMAFAISVLSLSKVVSLWHIILVGSLISLPLGFFLPHPNPVYMESGRFSSGGKDPNDYANLVLIVFLVCAFGTASYAQGVSRLLILLSAWLSLMAIPLSGSRTAIVSASLLIPLGWLAQGLRGILVGLIVLVLLGTTTFVLKDNEPFRGYYEAFTGRVQSLGEIGNESTWAGRIDIWRAAWYVFTLYPIGGVGLGNFAWVSPEYSATAARIASMREDGGGGVAHNTFLSVLAETGVIGFVLFLSLQIVLFLRLSRLYRRHALARGLLLGLLGYWVASLTLTWEYVKIPFFLYGSILAFERELLK